MEADLIALFIMISFLFSFLLSFISQPRKDPSKLRHTNIALDLPEIREHLGLFLCKSDLLKCARVSKTWNQTFAPLLYRNCVLIDSKNKRNKARNPSISALCKYSNSIRKLHYFGVINLNYYSIAFSNLRELIVENDEGTSTGESAELSKAITNLIQRNNRSLRSFMLKKQTLKPSAEIWEALSLCPAIYLIQVSKCNIYPLDMPAFWKACSKVKTLYLQSVRLYCGHGQPYEDTIQMRFPRLRRLCMESIGDFSNFSQLSIFNQALNLEIFQWKPNANYGFPIDEYQQAMFNNPKSRLRSLVLHFPIRDSDLALTISTMTDAVRLTLSTTEFSAASLVSLIEGHSNTIRQLKFHSCNTLTSRMVQTILTGCPSLDIFEAESIKGEDLVSPGREWVCLGLTSLTLRFTLGGRGADTNTEATSRRPSLAKRIHLEQKYSFQQLSRLTELRKLDISTHTWHSNLGYHLDLRLVSRDCGLQQLSTLTELEEFAFQNTRQRLREEDIRWMVEHWPRLRRLRGSLHTDSSQNFQLQVLLNSLLSKRRLTSSIYR